MTLGRWIFYLLILRVAGAETRLIADNFVGAMRSFTNPDYQEPSGSEVSRAVSVQVEKAVLNFVEGLNKLASDPGAAANSFQASLETLPKESGLAQLVSIYLTQTKLASKNPRQVLKEFKIDVKKGTQKSGPWRLEQFSLMLEIALAMGRDESLLTVWTEMEKRLKGTPISVELAQKITKYLETKSLQALLKLAPILESMAAGYPNFSSSRWAFGKLQELMCERKNPYVVSQFILSRWASNAHLDEGLKQYLIEMTKGPMRNMRGAKVVLTEPERISFLIQLRFWSEARRILEEQIPNFADGKSKESRYLYAKYLSQLAQLQAKQNEYELSLKTWSLFVENFGAQMESRLAKEGIADALAKLRYHDLAASYYGDLGKASSADPVIRWHHFWNTVLSKNYQAALDLLDRPGYVPQRDRGIDGGLEYWRGVLYEKLGRGRDADEQYQKILSLYGDSYYSLLVALRRPKLEEAVRRGEFQEASHVGASQGEAHAQEPEQIHALEEESNIDSSLPVQVIDTQAVVALKKRKQLLTARRILRSIHMKNSSKKYQDFLSAAHLSFEIHDYSYGARSIPLADSPMARIPSHLKSYLEHLEKYKEDWKIVYPYAFQDLLKGLTDQVPVDPLLVLSIMRLESLYNPDARSHVGAQGLMQLMPFTAIRVSRTLGDVNFNLSELNDPVINIGYGSSYIKKLLNYYLGNHALAIAAYNGGPLAVDSWVKFFGDLEMDMFIETMPFRETRRYVKLVFRNYDIYKILYGKGRVTDVMMQITRSNSGEPIY